MGTENIIRQNRPAGNQRENNTYSGRVSFSLLAVIFIVTAALVYALSPTDSPSGEQFSLTAMVVLPEVPPDIPPPNETILSDANLSRALGLAAAARRRPVPRQSESLAGRPLADIRQRLSVKMSRASATPDEGPSLQQSELSITYSGSDDPDEACRLVDILAEQAAKTDTQRRRAAAELAHQQAAAAVELAGKQLSTARAQYDAFVDLHFTAVRQSAAAPVGRGSVAQDPTLRGSSSQASASQAPSSPSSAGRPLTPDVSLSKPTPGLHFARPDWTKSLKSPTRDNPRWTELNNRLAALMVRRAALLQRMLPAHPEVQNIDLEIENLERKIASTPRELPRHKSGSLPPIEPRPPDPTDDLLAPSGEGRQSRMFYAAPQRTSPRPPQPDFAQPQSVQSQSVQSQPSRSAAATSQQQSDDARQTAAALAQQFQQRRDALDAAQEQYEHSAAAERRAWQQLLGVAAADVIPAVRPPINVDVSAGRHVWMAIVAVCVGLCAAAGVGLFSLGISPPACFANAAEVRAALNTAVVGTIPAVDAPGSGQTLPYTAPNAIALAASAGLLLTAVVAVVMMLL